MKHNLTDFILKNSFVQLYISFWFTFQVMLLEKLENLQEECMDLLEIYH